ncbi:MAG: efflux RND transporter periplasmic adaptor subunit [Porticoccus sp.]
MKNYALLICTVIALLGAFSLNTYVAEDHGEQDKHENEHTEETKGPNGGKLLSDGDFSVELKIFETGVPPEMRLYAYDHGNLIAPGDWQVSVSLDRLGGDQNQIQFSPELDYQVGSQEIKEPHSYDVTIKARYENQSFEWHYDSHEGRTFISDRQLKLAGVKTAQAGPTTLSFSDTLFGVISAPADSVYRINAPYPGLVETVYVKPGETVKKGQRLLTLTNTDTLQRYSIKSPSNGEVTERFVNQGDRAKDRVLLEVVDLSTVWVEMSAFPESIEKLAVGQPVTVRDLHHHEAATSSISYVAPQMTGGHIARTRAVIDNPDGHWRPGMHIKAEIQTDRRQVPLAIKASALQSFRDMPVVFAKFGNTFEVRMVELGESNGDMIEVLGGLKPGTEYVADNSFLIKADILKSGASHDH